jgi:superfamily II DNA/RNA helicase
MVSLIIPDKWQQDAVNLLREGKGVVVHAPTGAGKTYIFELLYESLKGQAVYTVPTRALANDKLAEWRARGWDVGISTGDIAENLDARVVVATLETQKGRFVRRQGPRLLVVDEYQLLADPVRGMNYELILSLAPKETQLLLLSGSVANPQDVVSWLRRLERDTVLVSHSERPVRLDEVFLNDLPVNAPSTIRGYWPKLIARALLLDLGPILVFAPRRQAAEELAQSIAAAMAPDEPLPVSQEQAMLAGEPLARLLRNRVAYHHSGLSYTVRAGLIEPLAKRGHLRVVVATMGLAAGINFSMRSVLVTGTHYQASNFQRQVRPDELLQMFGRAGRRGLDEAGFALVTPEVPRLHEAYPLTLRRAEPIDWPSMLAVMTVAAEKGEDPFLSAMRLSRRLFSVKPLNVGVEGWYDEPDKQSLRRCGLAIDVERGRLVRRHRTEMRNSVGEWEPQPEVSTCVLGDLWEQDGSGRWRPALTFAKNVEGNLYRIRRGKGRSIYGREVPLVVETGPEEFQPVKWLRRLLREKYPLLANQKRFGSAQVEKLISLVESEVAGTVASIAQRGPLRVLRITLERRPADGYLDAHGVYLANPETRRNYPAICQTCTQQAECEAMELPVTPAYAWRRIGLIDDRGYPTRRGVIFSYFNQGEGLAIAAALEEVDYSIIDLVFDLANLRAGHRFAMDDSPYSGRLGIICQQTYERLDLPGYLEMGIPPAYGAGASEIVREVVENQTPRQRLVNEQIRPGDIERAITEWRSLLRQIVQTPNYPWERWSQLKEIAAHYVHSTRSPAREPLPTLLPAQQLAPRSLRKRS